jgi:hypothetical protein
VFGLSLPECERGGASAWTTASASRWHAKLVTLSPSQTSPLVSADAIAKELVVAILDGLKTAQGEQF